jgi:hypothetical protein
MALWIVEIMRKQELAHPYFLKRKKLSSHVKRPELYAVLVTPSPERIEKLPNSFWDAKKIGVSVEQVENFCPWRWKPLAAVKVLRQYKRYCFSELREVWTNSRGAGISLLTVVFTSEA